MRQELLERLLNTLYTEQMDLADVKAKFTIILNDYEIKARETELIVREENKNEWMIKKFIMAKAVAGCSEKTIVRYKNDITNILNAIGKNADEVTADDIRYYMAVRLARDKVSKNTADNERRYLSSFYKYLHAEEIVLRNPMLKIDKVKQPKVKKQAFTEIEIEKIRDACRSEREKAIIETLISTGCRVSELIQIMLCDMEADKVVVHGKGAKDRIVYFNAKAQLAIRNYMDLRKDTNPYLFPAGAWQAKTLKGNTAILKTKKDWWKYPENVTAGHANTSGIESMCRRLGKRAGVENVHPHRFRRTCATMALRRGMPLEQVSKMLGHEEIATTQIYLDLTENELEAAHRKYVI